MAAELSPSPLSDTHGLCLVLRAHVCSLAWAVTIHKAQGLTLDKVVIDVGRKEFSTGLTFAGDSSVRHLEDLPFDLTFPFQRVAYLANSQCLQESLLEDTKLLLEGNTLPPSCNPSILNSPTLNPVTHYHCHCVPTVPWIVCRPLTCHQHTTRCRPSLLYNSLPEGQMNSMSLW